MFAAAAAFEKVFAAYAAVVLGLRQLQVTGCDLEATNEADHAEWDSVCGTWEPVNRGTSIQERAPEWTTRNERRVTRNSKRFQSRNFIST